VCIYFHLFTFIVYFHLHLLPNIHSSFPFLFLLAAATDPYLLRVGGGVAFSPPPDSLSINTAHSFICIFFLFLPYITAATDPYLLRVGGGVASFPSPDSPFIDTVLPTCAATYVCATKFTPKQTPGVCDAAG
jgi:hypothetical protein